VSPCSEAEAEEHIATLEQLLIHGPSKGNKNLSATAITRGARGFLWSYHDDGFTRDDDPIDDV
jgi:hypothetical protein